MDDVMAAFEDMAAAVERFDRQFKDFDFSPFTFEQITLLERRLARYPAEKVKNSVHNARQMIIEREYEQQKRRDDRLRARYGYYGGEDAAKGLGILEVKAYERTVIRALYEIMTGASDEEIRSAIKKRIPPITDAEIDAYRTNAKER